MPGLYLLAILGSAAGIALLDRRFRLAAWAVPVRTLVTVLTATGFFLIWDAVGITSGVFVKGGSPAYVGVLIAPELPLEEPVFLAFLSYLALVAYSAALRMRERRGGSIAERERA